MKSRAGRKKKIVVELPSWIEVKYELRQDRGACPPKCPNRPRWCENGGENCRIIKKWQKKYAEGKSLGGSSLSSTMMRPSYGGRRSGQP